MMPECWPDWRGEIVVVVASGPSAKEAPLDLAREKAKVIVVNESWRLAPWADMLFAADFSWWRHREGVPEFCGIKVTSDERSSLDFGVVRVPHMKRDSLVITDGFIGGNNSGFQAFNLAVQLAPRRIALVGFDMTREHGAHWHEDHPVMLGNPTDAKVKRWRQLMDSAAETIKGIEVVNCSEISALTAYPKVPLEQVL